MDRVKPKCSGAWTSQHRDRRRWCTVFFDNASILNQSAAFSSIHGRLVRYPGRWCRRPSQIIAINCHITRRVLTLPPTAMNQTRLAGKAGLIEAAENATDVEQVTDSWFSDETQVAMRALVDNLKNK